ncbi:PH domain-containing protein [Mycobacterium sp. M1]|uniref:PH domain-containing protein n=1 Tax=Mycolicibacter acidiphilus TaxID=2835306 RepID=A0ABS5RFN8_9MYCO|nr:PH domain-containing protein [Mycolicibacter acidiphilus]MBS9532812.1 PH domain-containing protein [Mycolicibacter acidiphilus]
MSEPAWQRLSPRMLVVHPLHELLRELPLLAAAVFFGSTTGNQSWVAAVVGVIAVVGVLRWVTTTYRIDPDPQGRVQLRSGVLRRRVLSVPRNRIRSVETEARLLHRLLGLTVLRVSTGQHATEDSAFELNAVETERVPALRELLLATAGQADAASVGESTLLARWQPSWLRYTPLSLSGLVTIFAAAGAVYQSGIWAALQDSPVGKSWLDAVERFGVQQSTAVLVAVLVVVAMLLAVLRSLITYGNLVLTRRSGEPGGSASLDEGEATLGPPYGPGGSASLDDGEATLGPPYEPADVLELRYGLLRVRQHSYDMRRLRGGTLRRPLLVRLFGGARLDAAMTGVTGAGESSILLPPCPFPTAETVLTGLVGDADAVSGPVRRHGPVAARRRWTRAMMLPVAAGAALGAAAMTAEVPAWWWAGWAVLTVACALLAADRVRVLGHRVDEHWLVAATGSWEQRRYCLATAGIVGWTVRQSWFQRRAGVATLIAATAAGVKAYRVLDVPVEWAWSVAATASPWVAESRWAS